MFLHANSDTIFVILTYKLTFNQFNLNYGTSRRVNLVRLCTYLKIEFLLIAGSIGPCPPGHQFIVPQSNSISAPQSSKKYAECVCKDGHVKWFGDGACYRPYTRGPCSPGYIYSVNVTVKLMLLIFIPNMTGRVY